MAQIHGQHKKKETTIQQNPTKEGGGIKQSMSNDGVNLW